jgi:hypothetical protein
LQLNSSISEVIYIDQYIVRPVGMINFTSCQEYLALNLDVVHTGSGLELGFDLYLKIGENRPKTLLNT